jgi:hypothetical protein
MTALLDTALDDVLARLQQGEALSACLARWPGYADELRPLAETALAGLSALSWVEPPSRQAMARLRAEYGRRLDRHLAVPRWQRLGWGRPAMRAAAALAAVVLFLGMLAAGAVARSADTLPGDTLYPVKRLEEEARLLFAWNTSTRARLEGQFGRERIREVQAVLASRRPASVEFEGRLESMDGNTWRVAGLPLTVTPGTAIEGRLQAGNEVSVRARALGDGTLQAIRIRLRQNRPAPGPHPGATGGPFGTPTWTRYPTAAPRPTDLPTAGPRPTVHPVRSPQPPASPTAGPRPTGQPGGQPTGGPHATAGPTGSPRATAQPTSAPRPTGGADPTGGPPPTAQPTGGPRSTPQPTGGPRPTDRPRGGP